MLASRQFQDMKFSSLHDPPIYNKSVKSRVNYTKISIKELSSCRIFPNLNETLFSLRKTLMKLVPFLCATYLSIICLTMVQLRHSEAYVDR